MTNPDTAHADIARLEADLALLDELAADLEAQCAEKQVELNRARTALAEADAEAKRKEREPADRERLEALTETLRARLRTAPASSPTVQRVRGKLETLADENLSVAARLEVVRGLLDEVKNYYIKDRETWDANTPRLAGRGG